MFELHGCLLVANDISHLKHYSKKQIANCFCFPYLKHLKNQGKTSRNLCGLSEKPDYVGCTDVVCDQYFFDSFKPQSRDNRGSGVRRKLSADEKLQLKGTMYISCEHLH